jgi:hypothetical protein
MEVAAPRHPRSPTWDTNPVTAGALVAVGINRALRLEYFLRYLVATRPQYVNLGNVLAHGHAA